MMMMTDSWSARTRFETSEATGRLMSNRGRVQPVADTGSAQTEAQTAAGARNLGSARFYGR